MLIRLIDVMGEICGFSLEPYGPNFAGLPADDARRWAAIRAQHSADDEVTVSAQLADRLVRVLGAARAA